MWTPPTLHQKPLPAIAKKKEKPLPPFYAKLLEHAEGPFTTGTLRAFRLDGGTLREEINHIHGWRDICVTRLTVLHPLDKEGMHSHKISRLEADTTSIVDLEEAKAVRSAVVQWLTKCRQAYCKGGILLRSGRPDGR